MKSNKSWLWWLLTVVFTIGVAYYQRTTGPSYPVQDKIELNGEKISFKLPRTSDEPEGQEVRIKVKSEMISGVIEYMRYKSFDTLTRMEMKRKGEELIAVIPPQPPAGKVIYKVWLITDDSKVSLTDEPVIIRYKGIVPSSVLIPHILLMFLAMVFSTRTGIEALIGGKRVYRYSFVTLVCLFIGGGILGPVVQKYAFGAYWTGWPFGNDLTDNKTLLAIIFWIIAFYKLSRNKLNRKWAVIASVILLAAYLIPHSMFGSELDYTKTP